MNRRDALRFAASVTLVAGCGSSGSIAPSSLEIAYSIDAARPRQSVVLRLPLGDTASVFLGSSFGAHGDTLGHFSGTVAPEKRRALAAYAEEEDLLSLRGGPNATAEGSGYLTLGHLDQRATIGLAQSSESLLGFRKLLDGVVEDIANRPLRALKVSAALTPEGALAVTFTGVGTEPYEVLAFDPARPTFWVRVSAFDPTAQREIFALTRADVVAQAEAGTVPRDVVAIEPGKTLSLVVPRVGGADASPPPEVVLKAMLWEKGVGVARPTLEWDVKLALGSGK